MISFETLPTLLAVVIAPCIVFIESFRALPFNAELIKLRKHSTKSVSVIRSSRISDHWKGMVIPHYARLILQSTCLLGFFLLLCCSVFTLTYLATGYLLKTDLTQSFNSFLRVDTQISALLVGTLYAILRTKFTDSKHSKLDAYSRSSSFLHHLSLNYKVVRELAFDLDCAVIPKRDQPSPPPVFVSGLARGGTTILLEALYSTGVFSTLTYRNMPFVTAPYLWPKISQNYYQTGEKKERAHGDRLEVNFDSPEAFEEIFWLTFSKEQYVQKNSLAFQSRDKELEEKYRKYVNNILAASSSTKTGTRYLAKNNNNLLRIELITAAFPDGVILVPFRKPIDHASSLLKQHQHFCQIHKETPFARKYMNWLGHHEFGENIKLFEIDSTFPAAAQRPAHSIEFWLHYWTVSYRKLLDDHSHQLVFFNYDTLCNSPDTQLTKLAALLDLDPDKLGRFAKSILPARSYAHDYDIEPENVSQAQAVYLKLTQAAL
ncbi:sulfotransferase [Desulfosediminicola sp.]|uniref:sulfotransferase n=1 Tax=Desulfosediminicola sp. TaxID=2886825 RepID=UPI003AF28F33